LLQSSGDLLRLLFSLLLFLATLCFTAENFFGYLSGERAAEERMHKKLKETAVVDYSKYEIGDLWKTSNVISDSTLSEVDRARMDAGLPPLHRMGKGLPL
jgi:uncharacterized protein YfeS